MDTKRPCTYLLATFLLVGDSHTYQSFGRNLDELLRAQSESRVATFASWGTSPASWFANGTAAPPYFEHDPDGRLVDLPSAVTPVYSELLTRFRPQLTIIALGANLYGAPFDYSSATVNKMAQMTANAGSACIWVGPPDSRERAGPEMDELYGVLRGASAPHCRFVDSRTWTRYPDTGGDGLHYDYLGEEGLKQTRHWAQRVF